MMNRPLFAVVALFLGISSLCASPELRFGDGSANRLRLIFLAEGYTAAQSGTFESDVTSIFATFSRKEFYKKYGDAFNVYSVFTPSQQSGADQPSKGIYVNTAFDATFEASGIDRLLVVTNSKVNSFLKGEFVNYDPSLDIVVVVVNSQVYGGSGGQIATTSTVTSALEVAIHEIGHSFAKLADEYDTPYPGWTQREHPNSTAKTARNQIPWGAWIDAATPIPTPKIAAQYSTTVGLYEGSQYLSTGWYRPYIMCEMNQLNNEFCPVCTEAHITALYRQISPIDSLFPAPGNVVVSEGGAVEALELFPLSTPGIVVEWSIDGRPAGTGNRLNLLTALEGESGTKQISVVVEDRSSLIRNPSTLALAIDSASWSVSIKGIISAVEPKTVRKGGVLRVVSTPVAWIVTVPEGIDKVELVRADGAVLRSYRMIGTEREISTVDLPAGSYAIRAGGEAVPVAIGR